MNLDENLVRKLAKMSRIEFDGEESQKVCHQLEELLNYFSILNEAKESLNSESPSPHDIKLDPRERSDECVSFTANKSDVLAVGARVSEEYFMVPKILD